MTGRSGLGVVVFVIACAAACSSSPKTIVATDYDQTCATAADCVLIDEGSSCCSACGNAAINKKDLARYQSDAAQRRSACAGVGCPAIACAFSAAVCTAGKCASCRSASCAGDAGDAGADSGAADSGAADSGAADAAAD